MRPTSHLRRTPVTDARLGRVLQFPVRSDPHGQIELFPEPPKPDPHSVTQLIIHYTLLQMRVTRMASYLSPGERFALFGEYHSTLNLIEKYEEMVASRQVREAQSLISRTA